MRKVFHILFRIFGRRTPEAMQWIRNFLVRKYVQSAGKKLSIGRMSIIHKNTCIGNHSGVGYGCVIPDGVTIGEYVMMGPDVIIFTSNHRTDRVDIPMCRQGMTEIRPVIIEDDVWIGARACLLPGVTIGRDAVVGACAVVTKDVPPYTVVAGNPAKVVKTRQN